MPSSNERSRAHQSDEPDVGCGFAPNDPNIDPHESPRTITSLNYDPTFEPRDIVDPLSTTTPTINYGVFKLF